MPSTLYVFIDQVEEDHVTCLIPPKEKQGEATVVVLPKHCFPREEIKEGSWFTLLLQVTSPPSFYSMEKIKKQRAKLQSKDDGKDIIL